MIKNIPKSKNFLEIGMSQLNFAWEIILSLLEDLHEAEEYYEVNVKKVDKKFWDASKQRLSNSLFSLQHGVEFLLKSKIIEISPYLLIAENLSNWPKSCDKKDIDFADFKTVDAQDLIKIYNTFSSTRLSEEFNLTFNKLRKKRNSIVHTVDKRINLQAKEVMVEMLTMYKKFFPEGNWVHERRKSEEASPMSKLHSSDHIEPRLVREFSLLVKLLSHSELMEFFNFDNGQRVYICDYCKEVCNDYYDDLYPKTAILKPNKSDSTNLYCFVCEKNIKVERIKCSNVGCKGNVISRDYATCLTCGSYNY